MTSKDKTLKRWNLPGSTMLGRIGDLGEAYDELQVFASVRAHDKVRRLQYVFDFFCIKQHYLQTSCF